MSDKYDQFKIGYQSLTKDEIRADMDSRYSTGNAYPNDGLWIKAHHEGLRDKILAFIGDEAVGRDVLEFGCGSGGIAAHHLQKANKIIATDLSNEALNIARDFFKTKNNIEFIQSDIETIFFPEKAFDLAISKEVIEHLPNPINFLKNSFNCLKDGGIFIISTPNRDSLHLRVNRFLGGKDFVCSGDHLKEYTLDEMKAMLVSVGFNILAVSGVMLLPYHHVNGVFPDEIKNAENNNQEFVDMLKKLGDMVDPEFSFGYIIKCQK
jgi:2-polyprenyl-3-methyl-5-hydroxy-6-metoxy-1,4-benzoquinol methylase